MYSTRALLGDKRSILIVYIILLSVPRSSDFDNGSFLAFFYKNVIRKSEKVIMVTDYFIFV